MYYDNYINEQIARDRQMERMSQAARESRYAKARQALRIVPRSRRGR